MIAAGYMYKQVTSPPDWLADVACIEQIYSLSACIADNFGDITNNWRHNGFWLFDDPAIMAEIAKADGIDLAPMVLFYYEAYGFELNDDSGWSPGAAGTWSIVTVDDFPTAVKPPVAKTLCGFDVVTHMTSVAGTGCSPLSCNAVAAAATVNRHCLFDTFDQAKSAADGSLFTNCEPGALRIFAVYTVGL